LISYLNNLNLIGEEIMYNFKLKSFLGSIIVLGGLLLSACNGGGGGSSSGGGTPTPSPSPTLSPYNSITKFTVESALSVYIKDNQINVVMLYGTNFTESRNVTFTTTGKYVTLNNVVQNPKGTLNTFESGGTVDYIVYAENGESQTYRVTLIGSATLFAAYYPKDCKLNSNNNAEACDCLQDTTTGDVWTRTTSSNYQCYNSLMSESGACSGSIQPSGTGYIPNLNNTGMCGFNSGWDLPSESQLTTMLAYVSGVSKVNKGTWFNQHGFSDIDNNGFYWGQCVSADCALSSGASGNAWVINMRVGSVFYDVQNYSNGVTYGWGVHSRP
jgi:hypothetical protein